ncbi:MAG: carboxylesterase family protein [Paludibacteraceae bacterium]|nr:carboxylesterase family protein [Paludibacteraceae bacterium]MBN2788389.1 carboxylesterase family protein [Paludibacteraceae bacterium]
MKTRILLSILFYSTILLLQAQVVETQFGEIQGKLNGAVYEFLGIPFAKPPIGDLRWKAPENPDFWTDTLNTTTFAPVCPQKEFKQGESTYTFKGDEDCLYLNVWTPQLGAGTRPVLVFIHGGGNQQGGASETSGGTEMFVGKNMAQRGDAVIVTIQYRLGPLGFLVHPGLEPENSNNTSGNYAVLDHILALKWVQNNIAAFGGDPTKVMVFGESAGGVNVGNLLTTPLASGLFQRACIQSAIPVVSPYNDARIEGIAYVDSFTTTGTDVDKIAYMRTLPADSLVKFSTSPISGGIVQQAWKAVVDNVVFTDIPTNIFQTGSFNKVPLIIGSNSEEMSLNAPATVTPSMVTALIYTYFLSPTYQTQAVTLYPPGTTNEEAKASYINLVSDAQFTLGVRRTAQCISTNQTEPVWRYFFTHKHSVPLLETLGAYHGMELFYVFNNWENATLGQAPFFTAQDDSVQTNMLNYWVNFANTGNPNGGTLVNWPPYNATTDCYLEIKPTPNGSQCGVRTAQCNLMDNAFLYTPCTSSVDLIEPSKSSSCIVYPNPSKGLVFIQPPTRNNFIVEIFNVTGNRILSIENTNTITISPYPTGIYTILVIQDGKIFKEKIIKK